MTPTCCVTCPALPDGGSCPDGSTLNGYCSNGNDGHPYCSMLCHKNDPFCVVAPNGCASLTKEQIDGECDSNGDYGGFCGVTSGAIGIRCLECF